MANSFAAAIPPSYRNPIIHDQGPSSYPGNFRITDDALARYKIARSLFGTTQIINADGSTFRVKDAQYLLSDGSVGMAFLPVCDTGQASCADGTLVQGSVLVDALLRSEMKLGPKDPIFALMYYFHPELNSGTIEQFAATDKTEMGISHVGAYHGNGRTSNAPELYHNRVWSVGPDEGNDFGYPANLVIASLNGVDQVTLNRNLNLVDDMVNCGVRFPADYKNSQFRMIDLNTSFMFYRDWVEQAHYLREDTSWFTYCAAHKTVITNIGFNLPHNQASFQEIWGEDEGSKFWNTFCIYYMEIFGVPFTQDRQTSFTPLWKQQGLTPAQIKPFTLTEYIAWDAARLGGMLGSYPGFKPLPVGAGLPWGAQMNADLVNDFVQTYADFVDAGPIAFTATVFGLSGPVCERGKIPVLQYLFEAMPIAQQAMRADAAITAPSVPGSSYRDSPWYHARFAALFAALGGKPADAETALAVLEGAAPGPSLWQRLLSAANNEMGPDVLAWLALDLVRTDWDAIMAAGQQPLDQGYDAFMAAIQADFQKARDMVVHDPNGIQFNASPPILHMIITGMYACAPQVTLRTIATIMDYTELELVTS
jgi:hypothetical protein